LCFYADENARKKLRHLPLAGKKSGKVDSLILDMKKTPQTETQSVWDHGVSVSEKYKELISYLRGDSQLTSEWKMPDWVQDNKKFILDNLYPDDIMRKYHVYHDSGKPYCIEYDEDNRKHFPNHAEVSYNTYLDVFGSDEESLIVSDLIRHDMDVHLLKALGVEDFCNQMGTKKSITLLITALCELHSNAEMFGGGIESTGFKIKHKQTNKRGKSIINFLKNNENERSNQRDGEVASAI